MSKTIVTWGVFLWAGVFAIQTIHATPLGWEDGYKQIRSDSQALKGIAPSGQRILNELGEANDLQRMVVISNQFELGMLKTQQLGIPVLALPESGTLILLGLGLAGLASLIRRKD